MTDRQVAGTNLFGFHPNIEEGENLQIYSPNAYQALSLAYDSKIDSYGKEGLSAMKFKVSTKDLFSFIGIEELNQNFFQLVIYF